MGNDRSPESQQVLLLDKRKLAGVLPYMGMVAILVM